MEDKNESISNIIIGEHPKLFVLTLFDGYEETAIIGLQSPVLESLHEYNKEYSKETRPIHIFPDQSEGLYSITDWAS